MQNVLAELATFPDDDAPLSMLEIMKLRRQRRLAGDPMSDEEVAALEALAGPQTKMAEPEARRARRIEDAAACLGGSEEEA